MIFISDGWKDVCDMPQEVVVFVAEVIIPLAEMNYNSQGLEKQANNCVLILQLLVISKIIFYKQKPGE